MVERGIEHGPVDVLVLAAGEPRFNGSVLAELERQASAGTIRVLDAMILVKHESGVRASINLAVLRTAARACPGRRYDHPARTLRRAQGPRASHRGRVRGCQAETAGGLSVRALMVTQPQLA